MVFGCANQTVKVLVFVFNALIALAGLVVFATSLVAIFNTEWFASMLKDKNVDVSHIPILQNPANYTATFWVLTGVGALLLLVGLLGCLGACCESSLLIGLFFFIVLVLFLVQLVATVLAIWKNDEFSSEVKKGLLKAQAAANASAEFLKPFEEEYRCCGIDGATEHHRCDYLPDDVDKKHGCYEKLWAIMSKMAVVAVTISVVVLVIEFLAMLFSCILLRAFRQRGYYYERTAT